VSTEQSSRLSTVRRIYRMIGICSVVLLAIVSIVAGYQTFVSSPRKKPEHVSVTEVREPNQSSSVIRKEDFQQFLEQGAERHISHTLTRDSHSKSGVKVARSGTEPTEQSTVNLRDRWGKFSSSLRRGLRQIDVEQTVPEVSDPEFSARLLSGDTVQVTSSENQWLFINFWASWCAPCRHEMPDLNELYRVLPDDRFRLLGVNVKESPQTVRNFKKEFGVRFPVVLDTKGTITEKYDVRALPVTWILDPRGSVVGRIRGAISWNKPPAKDVIKRLIHSGDHS